MPKTSLLLLDKKKIIILLTAAFLFISTILLTATTFEKPSQPLLRWIAADNVNLRAGAKNSAEIITTLSKGTKIYVVELTKDYAKVSVPNLNNKRGWVNRQFITDTKPASTTGSQPTLNLPPNKTGNNLETLKNPLLRYIKGTSVNLRAGASTTAKVLMQLPDGTKVYVVQLSGRFAKVSVPSQNNLRGWVAREFLIEAQTPNPQPVQTAAKSTNRIVTLEGAGTIWSLATIVGDSVNLRSSNSLYSQVNATLKKGTKVYLVKDANPWFYVSTPKGKGWVFGNYVQRAKIVIVKARNVNIRSGPGKNYEIKQVIHGGGTKFAVEEAANGWLKVVSPQYGVRGWINDDFTVNPITATPTYPIYYINGTEVNFRTQPRIDADIIATYNSGVPVKVIGKENRWALVESKGRSGYIYSAYLTPDKNTFGNNNQSSKINYNQNNTSSNSTKNDYIKPTYNDANKSFAQRMIDRGMDLRGVPYRWGGTTARGFDCSGFIYYLLNEIGHGVPNGVRSANDFYTSPMGKPVAKEDLQPGDLVFFTASHRPRNQAGHVGIYLGDGDFLHASSGKAYSVTISSLSSPNYKRRYLGARRVNPRPLSPEERVRYKVQSSSNNNNSKNNYKSAKSDSNSQKANETTVEPEGNDAANTVPPQPPPLPKVEVETN